VFYLGDVRLGVLAWGVHLRVWGPSLRGADPVALRSPEDIRLQVFARMPSPEGVCLRVVRLGVLVWRCSLGGGSLRCSSGRVLGPDQPVMITGRRGPEIVFALVALLALLASFASPEGFRL